MTLGQIFSSWRREITFPKPKEHIIFWSVAISGLALDLWSKAAVFQWLQTRPEYRFPIIDGFLQLIMTENPGAAFGLAHGQRFLLVTVSLIALVVILGAFLFMATKHKLSPLALGLFAGGVCGNLYDRMFHDGLVRDFIDVVYWPGKHWPAFNVADSMLCIAVGLLIISSLIYPKTD
jgi:signal peptidase II